LTAIAAAGMAAIIMSRTGGGFAEIIQHGEVIAILELAVDTVYTVESDGMLNVVQISAGSVKMLDANCPDKHCLHHVPVMYSGQTIVCLPNRVIIQVRSADESAHDVILR